MLPLVTIAPLQQALPALVVALLIAFGLTAWLASRPKGPDEPLQVTRKFRRSNIRKESYK